LGFFGEDLVLRLFPLLVLPVIFYNLIAVGGTAAGQHDMVALLNSGISIPMFSGDKWHFGLGDLVIVVSIVFLFVEVVKATRTTSREIINHGLSMLVFVIALIEFITLKGFSTTTFFLIMLFALFDVVAGYTISIVAAEHDLGLGRAGTD
jgi:hypothetical protein